MCLVENEDRFIVVLFHHNISLHFVFMFMDAVVACSVVLMMK